MIGSRRSPARRSATVGTATLAESPAAPAPARCPLFCPRCAGCFLPLPFDRQPTSFRQQEPVGQQSHRPVVVEPAPAPPLEVVQARLFLQLLVPLLHRPAALPQTHRRRSTRARRQITEGKLQRAISTLLFDQPPQRFGVGTVARRPPLSRPHPHPSEVSRRRPLGSFPPTHSPQRYPLGQIAQCYRARAARGQPWSFAGSASALVAGNRPIPRGFFREDNEVRGHPDDVLQGPLLQPRPEHAGDPIAGIGHHRAAG